MRRIDEFHLKWPFYDSRRMVFELNQAAHGVNRKRVQRLMRVMGINGQRAAFPEFPQGRAGVLASALDTWFDRLDGFLMRDAGR
jgi:transposase InsO family protein